MVAPGFEAPPTLSRAPEWAAEPPIRVPAFWFFLGPNLGLRFTRWSSRT